MKRHQVIYISYRLLMTLYLNYIIDHMIEQVVHSPNRLLDFVFLSFADLKQYRFTYWCVTVRRCICTCTATPTVTHLLKHAAPNNAFNCFYVY